MKYYTVTITPDDGDGAETVVKLEVNGRTPRITYLGLTAGSENGLSARQLPAIDLELLLAAVMPAAGGRSAATRRGVATSGQQAIAAKPSAPKPSPTKPSATKTASGKKATAKKAPSSAERDTTATGAAKERVYRSMPDDFVSTYNQAPTVAVLAEVYGVPLHTAQGWVKTARKREMIPATRGRTSR